MSFDLTLNNYRSLCQAIVKRQSDCRFITYLKCSDKDNFIILRHDVDRKPKRALRMAILESNLGIQSTYFFRITNNSFSPAIMKMIESLGHEIGYHYEDLASSKGDVQLAVDKFIKHIYLIREHVKVQTICSHGSPLSKIDNRDICNYLSFIDLGILGDASISIKSAKYFTDTGGAWGSKFNIRDTVKNEPISPYVTTTIDIIKYITNLNQGSLYFNCHPERWTKHYIESGCQFIIDNIINAIKRIVMIHRNFVQ